MMGASEDRATLLQQQRERVASAVGEIMVPGYGIWTKAALKRLLEQRAYALTILKGGWEADE